MNSGTNIVIVGSFLIGLVVGAAAAGWMILWMIRLRTKLLTARVTNQLTRLCGDRGQAKEMVAELERKWDEEQRQETMRR